MVKHLLRPSVCACIAATLLVVPPVALAGSAKTGKSVRMNELQAIGTHNSYKRETSPAEQAQHDALVGAPQDYEKFLAYSHVDLPKQFERQGVRGLELDLFADPEGGLYANPLARRRAGLPPLSDPAWRKPGIKTFHIADTDYNTSCVRFVRCLEQIRDWSRETAGTRRADPARAQALGLAVVATAASSRRRGR